MKTLVHALLFAAFLAALSATLASCSAVFSTNRGEHAPAFHLTDLDGNVHELGDYKGRKVYLYFWASWCSLCLVGMGELDELLEKGEDFTVLTIVSPEVQAEMDATAFRSWFTNFEHSTDVIVLLDADGEVYERYGIEGYPSSVFIGSDGRLVEKHTGHLQNTEIFESMNSIR